ncbi:hypothetical protein TMatcc_001165 [Talaromyces marneffei ATCC 18224]|nr:uncharacterized protein EYB26_003704 [Talaromyces marneffei]QGA16037.1 hypothetical protein EYB26_003704 [Talaromyces marneffei]
MAVTELVLFHFKNSQGIDAPENEAIKANISTAIKAQESHASYPVHLLTPVEDPSYIYLLGGWDSVETHMEKWIPSKTNHDLLAGLQEDMEMHILRANIILTPLLSHGRLPMGGG